MAQPRLVRIADLHAAFPNNQVTGTRLVLTQSTYTLQKWLDALAEGDAVVATANRAAMEHDAPEAFERRGPWRHFSIIALDHPGRVNTKDTMDTKQSWPGGPFVSFVSFASSVLDRTAEEMLSRAYASISADERVKLCRNAVLAAPESTAAAIALASASRERQDLSGARAALDAAIRLAPDWEAAWYEDGKFWLGNEDLARARDAFQRAGELMPSFSAAFSNLGATLGELNRPRDALAAFEHALTSDPENAAVLNNLGVVNRELGRLVESEAACRRAIDLAPGFVFGHYNLGHTLFLAGRFADSLAAYEEGQRRDPEKNRRQACRLAIVRLACGDRAGAERDLWRSADAAPQDEREDLLLEAYEIASALVRTRPELATHQAFLDRIAAEISR